MCNGARNLGLSNCLSLLSFCYSFPVFTIVVLSSRFILDLGEFIYINTISFHPYIHYIYEHLITNLGLSNCLSLLSFCYSFPVFTIVVLSSRFILDLGEFIYINTISFHPYLQYIYEHLKIVLKDI
jgi:hypothetical protein